MDWFKNTFLPSFGICNGKRISEKQYNIFVKYLYDKHLHKETNRDNACILEYHLDNFVIITQASHAGYGKGWEEYYLTILKNKERL